MACLWIIYGTSPTISLEVYIKVSCNLGYQYKSNHIDWWNIEESDICSSPALFLRHLPEKKQQMLKHKTVALHHHILSMLKDRVKSICEM